MPCPHSVRRRFSALNCCFVASPSPNSAPRTIAAPKGPEKKRTYTTTTERKSFGELFLPQRKAFQAGGGYKNPIKTRKTISTTEISPLWTPFFLQRKVLHWSKAVYGFFFPGDCKDGDGPEANEQTQSQRWFWHRASTELSWIASPPWSPSNQAHAHAHTHTHGHWKGGKDPHPQDFSLTKKMARFTTGQFRPY